MDKRSYKYTIAVLLITCLCSTDAQIRPGNCSSSLADHYNVSETDPPGTQIFRFASDAAETWSMSIAYSQLSSSLSGQLDPYLDFHRENSSHFLLSVNQTLDLEDILHHLGIVLSALPLRLTCQKKGSGNQGQSYEVFIVITAVNEFSPEFLGSPYVITISENAPVGSELITLENKARDTDVNPIISGIYFFSLKPFDYTLVHGKARDDGRDLFNVSNPQKGRITVANYLDYELLAASNRTTVWLNVTAQDYGGRSNWTTVRVSVLDTDDLGPEFYVAGLCASRPVRDSPCSVIYKAQTMANTTGALNQIRPAQIFARDRDTINNSVIYLLRDSVDTPNLTSHLRLDNTSGLLTVIQPFGNTGLYSFLVVAKELSSNGYTAQTPLLIEVFSNVNPTGVTVASLFTPMFRKRATNVTGGRSPPTGSMTKPSPGASNALKSDNESNQVSVIGMAVLGALVMVLLLAVFVMCLLLKKQRLARIGSAEITTHAGKYLADEEEQPATPREPSPDLLHKKQEEILNSLPQTAEKANTLPPLQTSADPQNSNPNIFDGTRTFKDGINPSFFTTPGKTKVPLRLSRDHPHSEKPIRIEDDGAL